MTASARGSGGGFELTLELDTDDLLPGRLVDGRLAIGTGDGGAFRGARITLVGTETWRYDQTTTDSQGHTRTETHTARETPTWYVTSPSARRRRSDRRSEGVAISVIRLMPHHAGCVHSRA